MSDDDIKTPTDTDETDKPTEEVEKTTDKTTDAEIRESVKRLTRDLVKAAATLTDTEVRYLVDSYYISQKDRIRAAHQMRQISEAGEPSEIFGWLATQSETLENQIKRALDAYTKAHPMGEWMRSVKGIGPVISAGLLAHIDIEKSPTVGHIWAFAGLDPTRQWKKGNKRPHNAALKVICWKAGESFVKVSGDSEALYGQAYAKRKEYEQRRNEAGEFADQAKAMLERKRFGGNTDALQWYSGEWVRNPKLNPEAKKIADEVTAVLSAEMPAEIEVETGDKDGKETKMVKNPKIKMVISAQLAKLRVRPMLPPAHIHARAKRWAVKLFLSHLHAEMYRKHFGTEPPAPYPIEHLGHVHWIKPA